MTIEYNVRQLAIYLQQAGSRISFISSSPVAAPAAQLSALAHPLYSQPSTTPAHHSKSLHPYPECEVCSNKVQVSWNKIEILFISREESEGKSRSLNLLICVSCPHFFSLYTNTVYSAHYLVLLFRAQSVFCMRRRLTVTEPLVWPMDLFQESPEVHCATLHCSAVLCSEAQRSVVQCSVVQCRAVQCSRVQCSAVQCNSVQCSAVHCNAEQRVMQCSVVQWSRVKYSDVEFQVMLSSVHIESSCHEVHFILIYVFQQIFMFQSRPQIQDVQTSGRGPLPLHPCTGSSWYETYKHLNKDTQKNMSTHEVE